MNEDIVTNRSFPSLSCRIWIADMGNEMRNNNVSGSQEQEDSEVEAPNSYSEVPSTATNDSKVKAEKPVSSPKEEDFHERHHSLISEDPGVGVSYIKKEASNEKEDGFVNETASASEHPSETSSGEIQNRREPEDTEVQAPDESSTFLMLEDQNDECIQSVLSPEDGSSNVTASAFGTNPTETNHPNITNMEGKRGGRINEFISRHNINSTGFRNVGSVLRSDPFTLTTPHDSEEIKNETEGVLHGSVISVTSLEVEKHKDDMQKKEMQLEEEKLLSTNNTDEREFRITVGANVEEILKVVLNDVDIGDNEQRALKQNFDRKDSTDLQCN
ncbi:hypothetical protein IFM89_018303 [Coptis chinensis]|uniref:Uncharacterized protein n=1 Tax=Coptis chinensis TaxID=261450 RepID=A0A835GY54_9MAGN|nr:hypothetical protein IFM89_018303 [Coptis chinensis]